MNDSEILALIKKAMGVSFFYGKNIEGGDCWTVASGDVNSGGYSTLDEAIQKWAETQKWYNENKERLK